MLLCDIYDVGIKGDKQKLEVDKLSSVFGLYLWRMKDVYYIGVVIFLNFLSFVIVGYYFMCEFK